MVFIMEDLTSHPRLLKKRTLQTQEGITFLFITQKTNESVEQGINPNMLNFYLILLLMGYRSLPLFSLNV
jgi:hypothetical protein